VLGLNLKHVTIVPLRSIAPALSGGQNDLETMQRTLLAADRQSVAHLLDGDGAERAECIGAVYMESRWSAAGSRQDLALLRLLADQAGFTIDIARLRERLVEEAAEQERLRQHQRQLARYMSKDVVEAVLRRPELLVLGGTRRDVTVMFTDVRGFTQWASRRPPEQVLSVINRIFSCQVEVLFRHGGTLDKFLGDGLMALFGAPLASDQHGLRAVDAAVEMQAALGSLFAALSAEGVELAGVGIGIHSGEAAVGNIGSDARMEYTAIGDTVNIASRLCSVARPGQVLLSEEAAQVARLGDERFRRLPPVNVKGKEAPIPVGEARIPPPGPA
jgi:adenylate cyclase